MSEMTSSQSKQTVREMIESFPIESDNTVGQVEQLLCIVELLNERVKKLEAKVDALNRRTWDE